ncbi:hypothetical protein NQZ68_012579 [Dissostichus eleginoides]|nr:hypothetical protein NQZ68_012579 [Dissostichus eleginoides]
MAKKMVPNQPEWNTVGGSAAFKAGSGTLSSQIGGGEWSLLVAAKRLAASVKGPAHYSLPFTEPSLLCAPPPLPSAPPALSHSATPDLRPTVSPKVSPKVRE